LNLFGKKVVYDVHEDYGKSILSKHYIPRFLKQILSFSFNFIEKCSVPFFDLTIAATDHIQKKFSNKRAITIHNYPLPQTNSKKNSISETFKIIYPGPISSIRGITSVFDAIARLGIANIELILIGDFVPSSYKEYLMKFKAWENVSYKGVVSHEEVIRSIASADLGIECSLPVPNYLYAESNKIFEYMSVGIPVLCSNLPRIQEIVEGSLCGLCVNPNNPDEIAKAIAYLYAHPEIREQMGKSGRHAVMTKYNWEHESTRLLQAYQELIVK
jgi:glycosyltransferase involved in cell wall biosynthesis